MQCEHRVLGAKTLTVARLLINATKAEESVLWFHRFVSKRHSPFAITVLFACLFQGVTLFCVFPVVDRQCLVLARQCREKKKAEESVLQGQRHVWIHEGSWIFFGSVKRFSNKIFFDFK